MTSTLQRVDAWEFARASRRAQGTTPQSQFKRLIEGLHAAEAHTGEQSGDSAGSVAQAVQRGASSEVQWSIVGQSDRDGRCTVRLQGEFHAQVGCMRCGGPIGLDIAFDRRLRLCKSEQEADQLETGEDEDAVAAAGRVDLMQWLEDELLLSLPMFPVHDQCATVEQHETEQNETDLPPGTNGISLTGPMTGQASAQQDTHRPFETLARLVKKPDSP